MKQFVALVLCVVCAVVLIGSALADQGWEPVFAVDYGNEQEKIEGAPLLWYAWDVPVWSYMPFMRYMENWFKPVKLPIYGPVFELGEAVKL